MGKKIETPFLLRAITILAWTTQSINLHIALKAMFYLLIVSSKVNHSAAILESLNVTTCTLELFILLKKIEIRAGKFSKSLLVLHINGCVIYRIITLQISKQMPIIISTIFHIFRSENIRSTSIWSDFGTTAWRISESSRHDVAECLER